MSFFKSLLNSSIDLRAMATEDVKNQGDNTLRQQISIVERGKGLKDLTIKSLKALYGRLSYAERQEFRRIFKDYLERQ